MTTKLIVGVGDDSDGARVAQLIIATGKHISPQVLVADQKREVEVGDGIHLLVQPGAPGDEATVVLNVDKDASAGVTVITRDAATGRDLERTEVEPGSSHSIDISDEVHAAVAPGLPVDGKTPQTHQPSPLRPVGDEAEQEGDHGERGGPGATGDDRGTAGTLKAGKGGALPGDNNPS